MKIYIWAEHILGFNIQQGKNGITEEDLKYEFILKTYKKGLLKVN